MTCLPTTNWSFRRLQFFRHTFLVSLTACSVISAKLIHIYYHLGTLAFPYVPVWGPTIIFQDVALILLTRALTGQNRRIWTTLIALFLSLDVLGMATASITFRLETGSELHWRTLKSFPKDASGAKVVLTGGSKALGVALVISFISWLLTPAIHDATGYVLDSIVAAVTPVASAVAPLVPSRMQEWFSRRFSNDRRDTKLQLRDSDWDEAEIESASRLLKPEETKQDKEDPQTIPTMGQLLTGCILTLLFILWVLQPPFPAYVHLSASLPIVPFNFWGSWNRDTGRELVEWNPKEEEDTDGWKMDGVTDRLHISNLQEEFLEPLQETLASNNIKIKHVMLIKLESTRDDAFPLRNDSYIWQRVQESYNHKVPKNVKQDLADLMPTAEYLTGRRSNLGSTSSREPRGGLTAKKAFTAATYTLKSQVGSVCGISPMVVDYNQEWKNESNIYQPCLPHIFKQLNEQLEAADSEKTDDFRSWEWETIFMQSVTDTYDHRRLLMPRLGFNQTLVKEDMIDPNAPFYPPKTEECNYYGYADTELRPYFRKMLEDAKENRQRLFINHLTSTTHHPWGLPGSMFDEYMNGKPEKKDQDLNRYINTVGFVDKWLADMLDMLDEFEMADETLLVYVGDHGLSLPFDGNPTPYNNPHVGNLHVPLVVSHPRLPHIEIEAPVISYQILPTILDLLVSTSSLDEASSATLEELRATYEGQSLIRPQLYERPTEQGGSKKSNPKEVVDSLDGDPFNRNWQLSVLNPGGTAISIRDANRPYHLAAPLGTGYEWEFHDLDEDPYELHPFKRLDPVDLLTYVREKHGDDAVQWIGQASEVASWWWRENWRRWRYEGDGKHRKPT